MKQMLLAALALTFGLSAWACPDLTGTYMCDGDVLQVETSQQGGTTVYTLNGSAIPADNQWYSLPDSPEEKNAKLKMSCNTSADRGDFAMVDYVSDYYSDGQYLANIVMEVYFFMNGQDLQQDIVGSAKGNGFEQPINESVVCTRQ